MAGGNYSAMNKIRPGAYLNFETQGQTGVIVGTRGIATMLMDLDWGEENKLIELTTSDLLDSTSLAKVGLLTTDKEALLINLAIQNCNKLKLYRANIGGKKATVTLENGLKITAKYNGVFGNKIAILIKEDKEQFVVETYANGYFVDSQKVTAIDELMENGYVTFENTNEEEKALTSIASTLLTGGENGVVENNSNSYMSYFKLLRTAQWNTLGVVDNSSEILQSVVSFIKEMREDEGKYVQAVVCNYDGADYEGIINNVNGVVMKDGTEITANQFVSWVTGATAGADISESTTGKVVENAEEIINMLSNKEIIEGLQNGKFILSLNQAGDVKVEKDINSLHTFTKEKNYIFSKNRVIRELDEIGSSIRNIWETTYLGKVSNNDEGRTLFKSSIIDYLTDLQNRGAIQEFDSSKVIISKGNDIDSVIASIYVKPLDSMEFLYMNVNVEQ